ncbi:AAA family ATPase [Lentisalinibacter sediminis]|uniref:AAA family ATPase n=1 Tax=Lentisalinibacter sediminis TaxID=2992237 RepID=UPI0038663CC6
MMRFLGRRRTNEIAQPEAAARSPWLLSLAGKAGTGKTTIAKALCSRLGAVYVGVDGIEMSLRQFGSATGEPVITGYSVGFYIALVNLSLGNAVVADSLNPNGLTRRLWHHAAASTNSRFIGVEVHCSDEQLHQERIVRRCRKLASGPSLDEGLVWQRASTGSYQAWSTAEARIDTATGGPDDSVRTLLTLLR